MPNDHHVPQMYLRRFAVKERSNWYLQAADVSNTDQSWKSNINNVGAERNFYSFLDLDGVETRVLESFLGQLESNAVPALRKILDDPQYALPEPWPLPPRMRTALAWYMAAQIVRTTRQRKRLEAGASQKSAVLPTNVAPPDTSTVHARFIAAALGGIASALAARPWGLGHSSACLMTSDTPIVILDGQDDDDQAFVAAFHDIAFPLDPHRLIFMPNITLVEEDPRKAVDHFIQFDGLGLAVVDAMYAAADRYIYMHPEHLPRLDLIRGPRLAPPGGGDSSPRYALMYGPMQPGYTIAKRWATEHPPPAGEGASHRQGSSFGL